MARVRVYGATVWLTAAELADRLKVAQSTLWQWNLRNYGPPAVRIGGKLRYRVEAVEAWEKEQENLARDRFPHHERPGDPAAPARCVCSSERAA